MILFFRYLFFICVFLTATGSFSVLALEDIDVATIEYNGLVKIPESIVRARTNLSPGRISGEEVARTVHRLYRTGYFSDIAVDFLEDGQVLQFHLIESSILGDIELSGFSLIPEEGIEGALNDAGIVRGKHLSYSALGQLLRQVESQYQMMGHYNTSYTLQESLNEEGLVDLSIDFEEEDTTTIAAINIIGAKFYSEETLLSFFESYPVTGLESIFSNRGDFSKIRLDNDLDRLSSYYLDRGFIDFTINNVNVSFSADKKYAFISIDISEGQVYRVSSLKIVGDIVIAVDELWDLVGIQKGKVFSQSRIDETISYMTKVIGDLGYIHASVEDALDIFHSEHEVGITFIIDAGKMVSVRYIHIRGNASTQDHVIRREMRVLEGAPISSSNIALSRGRLLRLGFFSHVKIDTVPVADSPDLVDIEVVVEEQPSGSLGASLGYADGSGVVLGASVEQDNFLGTGNKVGININRSSYRDEISFNYNNPYFNLDGVSLGYSFFYTKTDYEEVNISSYSTDSLGISMVLGYPISEVSRVSMRLDASNINIELGSFAVNEIKGSPIVDSAVERYTTISDYHSFSEGELDSLSHYPISLLDDDVYADTYQGFIDVNGNEFDIYTVRFAWAYSTLNRGQLATRGISQSANLELSVPISDISFFKFRYRGQYFVPLGDFFTLRLKGSAGYLGSLDSDDDLPFFEYFFAGGFGSIRGFERNTVAPRSNPARVYSEVLVEQDDGLVRSYILNDNQDLSQQYFSTIDPQNAEGHLLVTIPDTTPDPFGGNILLEGSVEVLLPVPFVEESVSYQLVSFLDFGNVFHTECGRLMNCSNFDLGELRFSYGLGLTWITAIGPMTFSLAKVLDKRVDDRTRLFQFSLGRSF